MEAEIRTPLAGFDGVGGLEAWIAEQPWLAAPGGWVVLGAFQGWRFRMARAPGGVCALASDGWGEAAAWFVPNGGAQKRPGMTPASNDDSEVVAT